MLKINYIYRVIGVDNCNFMNTLDLVVRLEFRVHFNAFLTIQTKKLAQYLFHCIFGTHGNGSATEIKK
jgi:hypothetical protein